MIGDERPTLFGGDAEPEPVVQPWQRPKTAGEIARDEALKRVLAVEDAYAQLFRHCVLTQMGERDSFTSEDVTLIVGMPESSGAVGASMRALATAKLIEPIGFTESKVDRSHGALLRVWRVVR